MEESEHRKNLVEIIKGCSTTFIKNKRVFLKHKSLSDLVDYELIYNNSLEYAQKRGLNKEAEILEELKVAELWGDDEENELETQKNFLESLQRNKKNVFLESAIKRVDEQIEDTKVKIQELENKRFALMANSAETYATNRANDFYIINSYYKDKEQTEPLYSEEEYDYLDKDTITEVLSKYTEFNKRFSEDSIQHLVLQDFYKVYYPLSESCTDFLGKPALELTNFQLNLLVYTRVFKNIFENFENIPEKIYKDPKGLLDYAGSAKVREEALSKIKDDKSAAATIVGATNEDLKSLGVDSGSSISLHEAAKKKGGSLSMKDLMKLNGL